jgi:hypothetical protein
MAEKSRIDEFLLDLIKNKNPSKDELLKIIQQWRDFKVSISPIGEIALEKLKTLNPTVEEIMQLYRLIPDRCWVMLKNTCFSRGVQHTVIPEEHLRHIVMFPPPFPEDKYMRVEIAKLLLENFPGEENEKLVRECRIKINK